MDRSSGYLWIRNSLAVIAVSFLVVFAVLSVREGIWQMEGHAAAQEACGEFVGAPFPMFSDCLEEQGRLHDRPIFAPGLPWLIAALSAATEIYEDQVIPAQEAWADHRADCEGQSTPPG